MANTRAQGFRVGAQSFLAGVRGLVSAPDLDTQIACHVLAAFAIECALKSFLTLKKVNARSYGHDLVKLWDAASSHGLGVPADAPHECRVISALTTGPLFYARYRYGSTGALLIAGPVQVMVIEALMKKTEAAFP